MSQHDIAQSEDIDGFSYKVMMLDPLTAADIIADVGYILAPVMGALGGLLASGKKDVLASVLDGDEAGGEALEGALGGSEAAIEKAVIGFFERFGKAKQRELIKLLSKMTLVVMPDGSEPGLEGIFAAHFRGRIKALYRWFWFAMKTQFGDFFDGQGTDMNRALAQVAAAVRS